MSLWQAQPPVPNCIPYTPYTPGMGTTYNPQLLIPPRHFVETINYFNSFFYLPGSDYLVAWASTIITAWPSWAYVCFYWDANTGNYLGRSPIIDFAYISSTRRPGVMASFTPGKWSGSSSPCSGINRWRTATFRWT